MKALDRSLESKVMDFMRIRDKKLRKELLTQIHECKIRSNNVVNELRNITANLSNLSNEVIAKLNDLAYKGINKSKLKKMLDKRAL